MGKKNVNSKSSYGAGDANITVSGLAPDFYGLGLWCLTSL